MGGLTVAASDMAVAAIGAAGALGGALVGGLISGGVDYMLERRRAKTATHVAVRLVGLELTELGVAARYEENFLPRATPAWTAHREALAEALAPGDWTRIMSFYVSVAVMSSSGADLSAQAESIRDECEEVVRLLRKYEANAGEDEAE